MRVRDRALARSVGTRGRLLTGPRQKYQEVRERIRAAGGVEALRKICVVHAGNTRPCEAAVGALAAVEPSAS